VSGFGFESVPRDNRVRLTSNADQNLRLRKSDGKIVDQPDDALAYDAADTNAGADPVVTGSAYDHNNTSSATSTLFGIDTNLDILVKQDPENAGTLHTVGALGIDVVTRTGFDILTDTGIHRAYAALQVDGQERAGLYTLNLATGAATRVGTIGGNRQIVGLAMFPA
jgi:Domain of unknown function (DUF4394)